MVHNGWFILDDDWGQPYFMKPPGVETPQIFLGKRSMGLIKSWMSHQQHRFCNEDGDTWLIPGGGNSGGSWMSQGQSFYLHVALNQDLYEIHFGTWNSVHFPRTSVLPYLWQRKWPGFTSKDGDVQYLCWFTRGYRLFWRWKEWVTLMHS